MNVAIVHDSLAEFGGAERVLRVLLELFPNTDLYTAYADMALLAAHFPNVSSRKLHVSFLQPFPVRHHTSLIQAIAPWVWESFRLTSYDLVISQSMHIMSALAPVAYGTHICIIQSPPKNLIGIDPPVPLQRILPYTKWVTGRFQHALRTIPFILTNSKHSQRLLRKMLGISSAVLYPPVDVPHRLSPKKPGTYFLCVSRIDPTKNIDLAVRAATRLKAPLKVVGTTNTPPYERYLKRIAGPTVEFLGFLPDPVLAQCYKNAAAFVFPSRSEDFGITPLEANAYGTPVVAYYGGGAKETVVEGKTGTFFRTFSVDALIASMQRVSSMRFDPRALYRHAKKFSKERFKREFMDYVTKAIRTASTPRSGKSG